MPDTNQRQEWKKGEVWQPSEIRWHGEQHSVASKESVTWIYAIAHVETHTQWSQSFLESTHFLSYQETSMLCVAGFAAFVSMHIAWTCLHQYSTSQVHKTHQLERTMLIKLSFWTTRSDIIKATRFNPCDTFLYQNNKTFFKQKSFFKYLKVVFSFIFRDCLIFLATNAI